MGRPAKLTPEVQAAIATALATGNTRATSCAYAGISYQTFLNWLERGEKAVSGQYFEFLEAIKKAEADAAVAAVATIKQASRTTWQAAAWWLERRYPAEWGKQEKQTVEHSGQVVLVRQLKGYEGEIG